ncbi:ISAs1 family transposase [Candidatus Neptunochlamydia vexilliferae]|nr:ISAs1 family transposase [Candidatus Neptunochlamydia vexilliferae]
MEFISSIAMEFILSLTQPIENHFKHVKDYRRPGSMKHQLLHILFFTLCAVTAGANDLVGVHTWIESNKSWLQKLFKLEHGAPSLSTLRITYMLLDPVSLSECFVNWVKDMIGEGNLRGICINGKAQRATALPDEPNSFVHIVSAWATGHGLTLGQQKVDGKSNEITAIPKLLDLIDIKGTVVTIEGPCSPFRIVTRSCHNKLSLKEKRPSLQ